MDFQESENRTPSRAKFSRFAVTSIIFGAFAFVQVALPSVLAQSPSGSAAETALHSEDPLAIYRVAGIDAGQETQIHQLVKDFESEAGVRLDNLRRLLKEMRELSLQPAPDEAAVLAKQEEINHVQNEVATARVKLLLKIRNLLKPEQKQNLVNLMKGNAAPSKAAGGDTASGSATAGNAASGSSEQAPKP